MAGEPHSPWRGAWSTDSRDVSYVWLTCAESSDDAGSWLNLVEFNRRRLDCIGDKFQLTTKSAVSRWFSCWLHKLIESICTVAATCVLYNQHIHMHKHMHKYIYIVNINIALIRCNFVPQSDEYLASLADFCHKLRISLLHQSFLQLSTLLISLSWTL